MYLNNTDDQTQQNKKQYPVLSYELLYKRFTEDTLIFTV